MRLVDIRDDSVLLTGSTGILGSRVLVEAIDRGYRPIALMRDGDTSRAKARLRAVLRLWGREDDINRIAIVRGDTRETQLGLDDRTAAAILRSVNAVVHCAASTSFDPKDDEDVWATNAEGVAGLVSYLSGEGIPLYHVSTAYVAGARRDCVFEHELDDRHGFTNTYERSKWDAERRVREAFASGALQGAIFRPGIIVGASTDGAITDFQNVYGFLRLIDLALNGRTYGAERIRLVVDGSTPCNFVPVDWTAQALWHIIDADGPCGRTYHLTSPHDTTLGDVLDWGNALLADSGVRFEFVQQIEGAPSFLEQVAGRSLRHYTRYTLAQPRFDATNTLRATESLVPFPEMGPELLDRMFGFARARGWKGALATVACEANEEVPVVQQEVRAGFG